MTRSLVFPIAAFELTYHLKRVSTYVYCVIWFAVGLLTMSLDEGHENSVLNSPATLAEASAALMAFGVLVVSAICGMAVCRDFEEQTYQLFFTTPLRRRDYLGGRLAGALLVSLLVFTAIPLGLLAGTIVPWADRTHMAPIQLWAYVQPFLLLVVTTVCCTGAAFFAIGALSRSIVFVYLQGVLLVALYLGVNRLVQGNLNDFWPALFDPFGLRTSIQVTKYWTLAETNIRLIPLSGAMLWNRLLWAGVALASTAAVFRFFPFSAEAFARRRGQAPGRAADREEPAPSPARVPAVPLRFGGRATLASWVALTRLRVRSIVTDLTFAAIAVFTIVLDVAGGWGAPRVSDTPVYPVTYLMTGNVGGLMAIVITAMYAGELVWKERALKYDQVHDSLPIPTWMNFASQLAALTAVQVLILLAMMATGIAQQAAQGYFRFEPGLYVTELFGNQFSTLVMYSALAIFLQTVLPNKFLGHAVVIGLFLAPELLAELMDKWNVTIPAHLYDYGTTPDYTYSAMNRYGPYVKPIVWYLLYWGAFAAALAAGAMFFSRRGTDQGWTVRWRQARARFRAPLVSAAGTCVASCVGIGGYLYYDARVLNTDYASRKVSEARWARYEKTFKPYEALPQPKITAVDLNVDLVPEQARMTATGTYTLVNKTTAPIADVHVFDAGRVMRRAAFDRPHTETLFDAELKYHIYHLAPPLEPGGTTHLTFMLVRENRGFQDTGTAIVANGTFSGAEGFPTIGYDRGHELDSEDTRRKQGLPKREDLPPPDRPGVRARNLFSQDADWITFKATVSTSPDQIAIAPGYLTREWTENGRHYFAYDMGDTKIANFYTFLSARYEVRREPWHGVNVEVYFDPQHPYNVSRMIDSAKRGLDYFTAAFGPYQFRQFRVLEFPRYAGFAQSFSNTVPYSESIGFIFHATKADDLDYPLYVTAHELAHQWWGHQVIGAFAQGSNILSEMLAEYSALMVVEHAVGPAGLRTYLKHDLDRYLRGRRAEQRGEQTLARVTRQPYVWYNKGSLVMYALKDELGEERLNAVLRGYLEKVRFQEPPYTTVDDFIETLRAALPPDRRGFITDLFDTITLFDNRAVSATWRETPDHRFAVSLKVSARKLRADDKGNEQDIPIDDLVDVGIFTGTGKSEKPLYLEKRRLTQSETTFEIIVDSQPTTAGIDPYNKLIDRASDDNVVSVKKS